MLSVLKAEQSALELNYFDQFVIIGIKPDGTDTRLAGVEPALMDLIKQWYYDKIQELETEFESL